MSIRRKAIGHAVYLIGLGVALMGVEGSIPIETAIGFAAVVGGYCVSHWGDE